jgi:hypothetical protein
LPKMTKARYLFRMSLLDIWLYFLGRIRNWIGLAVADRLARSLRMSKDAMSLTQVSKKLT